MRHILETFSLQDVRRHLKKGKSKNSVLVLLVLQKKKTAKKKTTDTRIHGRRTYPLTKRDWKTREIRRKFCEDNWPPISIQKFAAEDLNLQWQLL